MDLLIIWFLLTFCSADILEVCYPSVVRHRIDSLFPTSRLFCVSKQNDEMEYGHLEIINADDQWNQFSKSRFPSDKKDSDENESILYFGSELNIRTFKLPASISESDFCTGTQNIELRRNLTIKCKPLMTSDISSQCTQNYLLNAFSLLGNGEFMEKYKNETIKIPREFPIQMRSPVWNGSFCNGVVSSSNLHFYMNSTHITNIEINVIYSNLPGNVDNNWFEQKFSVDWISVRNLENSVESNNTDHGVGYKSGEAVYRLQNSIPIPFAVPTLGECYSDHISPSSVMFLRPITSICTIHTLNCEDARAKAKAFYDQVYPSELVSALSEEEAQPVTVGRMNVTWEQLSPSLNSCRLPVSSLLQIYYSKQGSTKNYHEVIVAGNIQLLLDDVYYVSGQVIRMPVSISFTDVTQPPKHLFAALPYIDVRLPHDFFYPFIRTSSSISLSFINIFILSVIVTIR